MKLSVSLLSLVFVGAVVVGCGSEEARTSTEGADSQAILDYEAAVEAMQKQDNESGLATEGAAAKGK